MKTLNAPSAPKQDVWSPSPLGGERAGVRGEGVLI
jgi:hypothetical protein